MIKAVIVVSPAGDALEVSQVVFDDGSVWVLDSTTREPRLSRRAYASHEEALVQNSRATTTAYEVAYADKSTAIQSLGRPPSSVG